MLSSLFVSFQNFLHQYQSDKERVAPRDPEDVEARHSAAQQARSQLAECAAHMRKSLPIEGPFPLRTFEAGLRPGPPLESIVRYAPARKVGRFGRTEPYPVPRLWHSERIVEEAFGWRLGVTHSRQLALATDGALIGFSYVGFSITHHPINSDEFPEFHPWPDSQALLSSARFDAGIVTTETWVKADLDNPGWSRVPVRIAHHRIHLSKERRFGHVQGMAYPPDIDWDPRRKQILMTMGQDSPPPLVEYVYELAARRLHSP